MNLTLKQAKALNFLAIETFSTPALIQQLLGYNSIQAAYQLLNRMYANKLISKTKIEVMFGRKVTLFGINNNGLALSNHPNFLERPTFQKSKVCLSTLQHKLDIQNIHICAINNGWTDWKDGSQLGLRKRDVKIPDAIAISVTGDTYAFEIEREIKSIRRYRDILLSHLVTRKSQGWTQIIYLCPTLQHSQSLEKKIRSIRTVSYQGRMITLTNEHFEFFEFYSYEQFTKKVRRNFHETSIIAL